MMYEDFKILNTEQYKTINDQYLQSHSFNRKEFVDKVFSLLNTCSNCELSNNKKFNKTTIDKILKIQQILSKHSTNISIHFNTTKINEVYKINIFTFIKNLVQLLSTYLRWQQEETKQYYKTLIQKGSNELTENIIELLRILENSNILFFKHM